MKNQRRINNENSKEIFNINWPLLIVIDIDGLQVDSPWIDMA